MENAESRVKRAGSRFGAAIVGAGLVLGGLLAVGTPSGAAVAAPVGCSHSLIYVAGSTLSPQIFERKSSGAVEPISTACLDDFGGDEPG